MTAGPRPTPAGRRIARRTLLFLARLVLRARARPFTPPAGPFMVIAPHPDDETLGCGGLLLRQRRAGHAARVVFLTDGSASHRGHPTLTPAMLARQRVAEAREAARRLGLDGDADTLFLNLPDGDLPRLAPTVHAAATTRLAAEIDAFRPLALFVTSRLDGSSEHVAAHALAAEAAACSATRPTCIDYLVWARYSPRLLVRAALNRPRRLTYPGLGRAKAHALEAHASQFVATPPWTSPVQPDDFANAFSTEEEFFLENRL